MLVLTRRVGESIRVGNDIVVTLVQVSPGKVRIGIQAPDDTVILRDELVDQVDASGTRARSATVDAERDVGSARVVSVDLLDAIERPV